MFGKVSSFLGFGAPHVDQASDLEARTAHTERVYKLPMSDSVKKKRIDEIMRTPGTGSGSGGVMAMPKRALRLERAVPAPPKRAVNATGKGWGPALARTPIQGEWNTENSAIDWAVRQQPTA